MVSSIFILDSKFKTLIFRDYRGDVPLSAIQEFPLLIQNNERPVVNYQGINYVYLMHNNVYLVALTRLNSNCLMIMTFLDRLRELLVEYFKSLEEESIRDNFILIYELFDEVMDFGTPQVCEFAVLNEYITKESVSLDTANNLRLNENRPANIYYKKNELFLDVKESIEMLVDSGSGKVIKNDIYGKIIINSYLSGMPNLKLGLNTTKLTSDAPPDESAAAGAPAQRKRKVKTVDLENVNFHQCVELDHFSTSQTIEFVPPDGTFELMSYRVIPSTVVTQTPLFHLEPKIHITPHSKTSITLTVRSQYRKRYSASFVEFYIPVPPDSDSPRFKASKGKVVYLPERSCVMWKIQDFGGMQTHKMKAEIQMSSITAPEELEEGVVSGTAAKDTATAFRNVSAGSKNLPIEIKFEIPYYAISGLQVKYLKIDEPRLKYHSLPWVRYLTKNGEEYSVRLATT